MAENEIEINQAFIRKGIDMSMVSAENLETGFISDTSAIILINRK